MTPDVYDVFQMLEFDKILRICDSIDEAINEYDLMRGFDITKTPAKEFVEKSAEAKTFQDIQISRPTAEKSISQNIKKGLWTKRKIEPSNLPLAEKIKRLISDNPSINIWEIKKDLNTEIYGHTRINYFKLFQLLKELNLDSKEKRYRYYRSR